uniref:Uncharacterized protein n=1 Tax=Rhizophora mucronata TaxID=61149 RepID=A0A2P2NSB9_RHIMU
MFCGWYRMKDFNMIILSFLGSLLCCYVFYF